MAAGLLLDVTSLALPLFKMPIAITAGAARAIGFVKEEPATFPALRELLACAAAAASVQREPGPVLFGLLVGKVLVDLRAELNLDAKDACCVTIMLQGEA